MRAAGRRRCGITLLELMLVLGLMVVVAALAVPALEGPLENQRLRKAADLLRAEWSKTRLLAMKSGRTQVFRYSVGSSDYEVRPWYGDGDYLETDLETMQEDQYRQSTGRGSGGSLAAGGMRQLPERIVFLQGETLATARSLPMDEAMAMSGQLAAAGQPVYFYPDGTTSTAQVMLGNEQQRAVLVELRGLTGIATVGDPQRWTP